MCSSPGLQTFMIDECPKTCNFCGKSSISKVFLHFYILLVNLSIIIDQLVIKWIPSFDSLTAERKQLNFIFSDPELNS